MSPKLFGRGPENLLLSQSKNVAKNMEKFTEIEIFEALFHSVWKWSCELILKRRESGQIIQSASYQEVIYFEMCVLRFGNTPVSLFPPTQKYLMYSMKY